MRQSSETMQSLKTDLGLNHETLTTVSGLEDRSGVLSLYAGLNSSDAGGSPERERESLQLDLEVQLFSAIASAKAPVAKQLYGFRPEIHRFIEDMVPGTGRALFYGLETGQLLTVFAPAPFDSVLLLRPRAFVLPMLCAIKHRDLVGVVALNRDHITVVEAEPGHAETIKEYGPEEYGVNWAVLGDQSPKRDAALTSHMAREVGSSDGSHQGWRWHRIALDIHHLGQRREWGTLVVSGDSHLTDTLKHQLRTLGSRNVLSADKTPPYPDPSSAACYGVAIAAAARVEREAALVSELIYQAVPHGHAVCGLDSTMKAMVGHAVCTLLFSWDSCWDIGWRFNECLEQMVELALNDGAQVVPVTGQASIELSRYDGFAARLRSPYRVSTWTGHNSAAYGAQLRSSA